MDFVVSIANAMDGVFVSSFGMEPTLTSYISVSLNALFALAIVYCGLCVFEKKMYLSMTEEERKEVDEKYSY